MSGVRESLLLLALFACGGGSAGADSDAGSAVVVPESGSSDSGDDSMSVDAASGAAASSSGSEGGSAARLDAAATCPSQAPQGIAPDFAAMICPEEDGWLVCTYPSGPCQSKYQCQCIEGLGGPATCSWVAYGLESCADAGDDAD
jgi:hypothetical protein